jgi:hypothetical protein
MKDSHRAFEIIFLVAEVIVILLYLTCTEYGEGVHPGALSTNSAAETA